jgi:hypothetical protein
MHKEARACKDRFTCTNKYKEAYKNMKNTRVIEFQKTVLSLTIATTS